MVPGPAPPTLPLPPCPSHPAPPNPILAHMRMCRVAWGVTTLLGCLKDQSEQVIGSFRDLLYVFMLMVAIQVRAVGEGKGRVESSCRTRCYSTGLCLI